VIKSERLERARKIKQAKNLSQQYPYLRPTKDYSQIDTITGEEKTNFFGKKIFESSLKEMKAKYKDLMRMNIPRMLLKSAFTRKELYDNYSKFKALSQLSKLKNP